MGTVLRQSQRGRLFDRVPFWFWGGPKSALVSVALEGFGGLTRTPPLTLAAWPKEFNSAFKRTLLKNPRRNLQKLGMNPRVVSLPDTAVLKPAGPFQCATPVPICLPTLQQARTGGPAPE